VCSRSAVATLSRRDRLLISTSVALIIALAWAYLIDLDRRMSIGMQHDALMADMAYCPTTQPTEPKQADLAP
jgi:predicted metal-binding membrane protein